MLHPFSPPHCPTAVEKVSGVVMEEVLDEFFCLYNQEKQADQADRLKSSQAILLKLLTDVAMPACDPALR